MVVVSPALGHRMAGRAGRAAADARPANSPPPGPTGRPDIDLILGTHAHVPQAYEKVNGTWVVYGMGDQIAGEMSNYQGVRGSARQRGHHRPVHLRAARRQGGRWEVQKAEFIPQCFDIDAGRVVNLNAALAPGADRRRRTRPDPLRRPQPRRGPGRPRSWASDPDGRAHVPASTARARRADALRHDRDRPAPRLHQPYRHRPDDPVPRRLRGADHHGVRLELVGRGAPARCTGRRGRCGTPSARPICP